MKIPRLAMVVTFILGIPLAEADPIPEYDMKAAFVYNFASFTEWPDPITGSFNLCIFDNDPIAPALETLEGKTIKGVNLTVTHVSSASQAKQCHVLYLGDQTHGNMHRLLNELAELPILTVTDENDLTGSGAMIGMSLENKKLTFDVNREPARRAHLNLSSKMLRLAQRVY